MAYPYLALQPTGNRLVSRYATAGSKNPLPLGMGSVKHISVMERTKEIGILRALGASKRNISQVFNAETFIIGCCAGILGICVSLLLLIPINSVIEKLSGISGLTAQIPVISALVLIALSIAITLIGGLLPAKKAAKKDPVIALRSE